MRRDISQYNRLPTDDDPDSEISASEETGWKLVHQDVFRPPAICPMFLCVFIGGGVQVLVMALLTVTFAAVGFISPANRGSLMFVMLVLFALMGTFAGYHCACLYKTFKGQHWQRATAATALLFPGGSFLVFVCLDLALASYEDSTGCTYYQHGRPTRLVARHISPFGLSGCLPRVPERTYGIPSKVFEYSSA